VLLPTHVLGYFDLGSVDLSLGHTGDGNLCFQGGQQVGKCLLLSPFNADQGDGPEPA
jgi:hypothetical protein